MMLPGLRCPADFACAAPPMAFECRAAADILRYILPRRKARALGLEDDFRRDAVYFDDKVHK